ncbi:hypothetical protein E9993_13240 [Labilibacter sediminis]|nr:hypothetical protein E9993_13240 [Labilibacter sediminis]
MTRENKKKYSKPTLSKHDIDNEISFVMMTYIDPEAPPPPPGAQETQQSSPTQENSFEDNPFGE